MTGWAAKAARKGNPLLGARAWLLLTAVLLLLLSSACIQFKFEKRTGAELELDKGRQSMNEGRWQDAIDKFDAAIEQDPDLAEAYANRGSAYGNLGQFDQAFADLDKAIEMSPNEGGLYTNRGRVYALAGKPDQALADYDRAIELDGEDHLAHLNRGAIYADFRGEFQEALAAYDRALELEPEFAVAYFNRGGVHLNLGDPDQALVDFDEAIRLGMEPELQAIAHNERGRVFLALEEYENALYDFGEAIELDPSLDHVYANRGLAYAELGDTEQAIAELEHFLSVNQNPALTPQIESFLAELKAE